MRNKNYITKLINNCNIFSSWLLICKTQYNNNLDSPFAHTEDWLSPQT